MPRYRSSTQVWRDNNVIPQVPNHPIVTTGGTAGDATHTAQVVINGTGQVTSLASVAIAGLAESAITGLTADLAAKAPLANPTFTGTATIPNLATAPATSHTATTNFGSSLTFGTGKQNAAAYDLLVNVTVFISTSTAGIVTAGVGPTSTPTTDALAAITGTNMTQSWSFVVPASYYLLLSTSGTITVTGNTTWATPL